LPRQLITPPRFAIFRGHGRLVTILIAAATLMICHDTAADFLSLPFR